MIQYDQPSGVVERWQPALDAIAPRTESGLGWLKLYWEPGEEWAPVGRWCVWEMMPVDRAPLDIASELRGPNPRNFGHFDRTLGRFVTSRPSSISQAQWRVYRETGCYGRPIWVVQGSRGGHKRFWNGVEENLSLMRTGGLVSDPPAPGDLPYAEPDQRTIEKLRGLDLVERFGALLHLLSNRDEVRASLDRREMAVAREMAEKLSGWLDDQVEEALTFTRAQEQAMWENASPDKPVPDYERGEEEFIEAVAEAVAY